MKGLKLNGKMKKRIRKAVAGVCLVSSVLVAAIPADYSGVAQAVDTDATVSESYIDKNEPMNYDADSGLKRNGEFTSDDNKYINYTSEDLEKNPSLGTERVAFEMIQNNEGIWTLRWMYTYYIPNDPMITDGIITGFNNNNNIEKLRIRDTVTPGYYIVSEEDFINARDNILPTKTWSLSGNPYTGDVDAIKNYFPERYAETVAAYESMCTEKGEVASSRPILSDYSFSISGNQMDDTYKYIWYCDQDTNIPGQDHKFTLVLAVNGASNIKYQWSSDPNDCDTLPISNYVYAVQYMEDTQPDNLKARLDENNFLYAGINNINAIGKGAFADSNSVKEMTVTGNIRYIGDDAFNSNKYITAVSLESGVAYIGNYVFKDCTSLSDVVLNDNTERIGKEAFSGCASLTTIRIPRSIKDIGFGAFSKCIALTSVDMSECAQAVTIGEYAFYDCYKLGDLTCNDDFSSSVYYSFGKAAFAVPTEHESSATNMSIFSFPKIECYKPATGTSSEWSSENYKASSGYQLFDENGVSYDSRLGDYLFAGRSGLKELTMPDNFGYTSSERVPLNTLSHCRNLIKLEFGTQDISATYDSVLFRDVMKEELCVYGPGFLGTSPSEPRKATWQAKPGSGLGYVPYVYTTTDGKEHYEVGIDYYRYDLEINKDDQANTATLVTCQFTDLAFVSGNGVIPRDTEIDLVIPGKVATYTITTLGANCFESKYRNEIVKDYIKTITIMDGSIQVIGEEVFRGFPKLVRADIGDSVEVISANAFSDNKNLEKVIIGGGIETVREEAFADCPKLTEVIWGTPVYNTQIEIADSAFVTGGALLYFEGDMAIGYGPFDYAMEDGSHYINSIGTRICFRSSGTNHYYVLRDEAAGENLLIDYPHYYDLSPEVRDRFEHKTISGDGVSGNEILAPTYQDLQLVAETRNLKLPEAVTSIDIKSFYLPENENNWIYLAMADDVSGDLGLSREDLYNNDNLGIVSAEDGDYHSGLFSGYYVDKRPLSAYETNYPQQPKGNENQTKGNDWITSIEMPGVTAIPDYAFDSCENLQSIIISEACEEIAPTAFRNCNALRTVTATGDYVFDNYILYKTLSDGTYQIMTCLPGRGVINQGITDRFVNAANDPKLADTSELEAGAFDGCAGLVGVDLSDTSIIKVPQNTFNNCKMLSEVTLPEAPDMIIEGDAFRGNGATLKVTIPAVLSIADSAFDPVNTVTNIYTKPECRFITTTYQKKDANGNTINSKANIYVHFIDSEFTVSFLNDDNTPYEERTVKSGSATYLPDVDPTPKKEDHSGWIFDSWKYYYTDWTEYDQPGNPLQSVTTDLYAVAQFVPDPEMPYYTITFRYDDYSIFETKQVAEGNNALLPSTTPQPKLLEHEGWIFSHWNYYDSTLGIENVTEDRNAIAVFVEPVVNPGEPEKGIYTITFRYDDYSIFEIKQVAEGNNGLLPSTTPQPKLSEHQGWNFSHWNYYDSTLGLENVTEDRNAIAVFTAASGNGDASGNNPSSGSSNNNNSSTSNNSASNNAANTGGRYNVVVENGAGGGYYAPGGVVTITAYAAPSGKVFDRWTTSNADIGFSNAFGASTTFIMPSHDVKVTATYKIPSASSNRVSQNSTTNSTNNKNSNTTSGSGTTTRNPSGGGTDVTVTTGTIDNNNKNLASATVSGSTDNFVVKITDSAAASAAVEQALRAQYGDLSNIRFVGFDISLYDETGTRKIENTAGLAVTITIPIPDDLVPYAGNNMAAGVVNGVLDPMAVKFTTIDGVPCMQFTATHFSPYAIYVNTNNLVSGVTDTTPKTGDIHPKWFLAIGLACISGVLFTWRDKKKVPV